VSTRPPTLVAIKPRPVYLPALDGLRALSVAAVVAFHLGRLHGGFIGVDIFFVISGFLITRLLLAERERQGLVDLVNFWTRRFRRLLPALLVVITAVTVAARWWMPSWRWAGLRTDAFATLAYVANWRFVLSGQSYFSEGVVPSPLRHAWSLAIEEQFYVLWPLVVLGILKLIERRYRLVLLIVSGVGALLSAAWMALAVSLGTDLSRLYYGTDTRAFTLLAGAWLAAWWDPVVADAPRPVSHLHQARPLTRAAGLALVPLAVLAVVAAEDTSWFYRVGFQSVAVLATVAVAGLATGEGRVSRLIGSPVLCWIGRRSYGIYLWSWPVQIYASSHFGLSGPALDLTVVAVTMGLATLSFRYIEEPIRTGWGQPRPVGRRAREADFELRFPVAFRFGVAVLLCGALIAASTSGGAPAPSYLAVSDAEAAENALDSSSGFGDDGATSGSRISITQPTGIPATTAATVPATTLPVPPGPPGPFPAEVAPLVSPVAAVDPFDVHDRPLRVMIAGDSVGWSLGWKPSADLTSSVRIEDRAIIGCGVMPPASYWVVKDRSSEQYNRYCLEQANAERIGLEAGPDVVLLWLGAWEVYDHIVFGQELAVFTPEYARVLEQRLQERVDQYRAAGVPTVMPTVPCFGTVAPRLGTERYDAERRAWVNDRLLAVAARNRTWVRVVDPTSMLCDEQGQARAETPDGVPIRADGAHFDIESAAWFWNSWLAGQLGAAFAGL
jgi:peptidoglycan/LPS O-acetylase OafA/YrhL